MVQLYFNVIFPPHRCGDSQCYFYMEVGRFSAIGSGELWMGTDDPLIAQNMHKTIIKLVYVSIDMRRVSCIFLN